MARGNNFARTRTRKRVTRGAQLRVTSSNEEIHDIVAGHNENVVVEDQNMAEANGTAPLTTMVHGSGSSKKIGDIRGWSKDDMLK